MSPIVEEVDQLNEILVWHLKLS